jgi:DNA-binding ferritin-like protein
MENLKKIANYYVAFLRSLYLIHQNNHWTCSGYDLHLMFERIYQSAQKDADDAAEKFVGLYGKDFINLSEQSTNIASITKKYADKNEIESSLSAELEFIDFSEKFYEELKSKISLGTDDLIMQICSNRETAVYLLKQSKKD